MHINITRFFSEAAPMDYSASVAEIGQAAGPVTWAAASKDAAYWNPLDTGDKLNQFRKFVRSSGGWNDTEVAAFTEQELNALCIQWIAGDIREAGIDTAAPDWPAYYEAAEAGQVSSRLCEGDDGEIYFDISAS